MKKVLKIFFALCFSLIANWSLLAQTSVQPTALSGNTSINFNGSTFTFNAVGVTYTYSLQQSVANSDQSKGTLCALQITKNGSTFWPSNYGGVKVDFNGTVYSPWLPNASSHQLMSYSPSSPDNYLGSTEVVIKWKVMVGDEFCYYYYKFSIVGHILKIKIEGDPSTPDYIAGIGFSNAVTSSNNDKRVINIPYLPIMNVLLNTTAQAFVSLFVDWESTNSSGIMAWTDNSSNNTGYYSQRVEYEKKQIVIETN